MALTHVYAWFFSVVLVGGGSALTQQATCDTDFSELTYSVSLLVCPRNCWRQQSKLREIDDYYFSGPICLAAIRAEIIDNDGGVVPVYRTNAPKMGLSTSAGSDVYKFRITCATNGNAQQAVNNVWCPSNCGSQLVRGSAIYHQESSVCAAAMHAGMLTSAGGAVTFYRLYDVKIHFTGETMNGVTSLDGTKPSDKAFTFRYVDECQLSGDLCQNNSTCVDLKAGYICSCTPGYNGRRCKTDIDECLTTAPCLNGGTCSNNIGSYSCSCAVGYTGKDCQTDINDCFPNPCLNGGACSNIVGSYSCACATGFSGGQCEADINECLTSATCLNGGTCINNVGSYSCSCAVGYTGNDCQTDINECSTKPCLNGGACSNTVGSYSCACATGFSGGQCQKDINECLTYPCQNGGTCSNTVGNYSCACATGFSGGQCQKDIDECLTTAPCLNSGTCINNVGSYSCSCAVGYTGKDCQTDINECSTNPCLNGGACSNTVGSYSCACATGFSGGQCQKDINECLTTATCLKGGTCINNVGSYSCLCAVGYTGNDCQTEINECLTNPCQNGGTCSNTVGSYSCACATGFSGGQCKAVSCTARPLSLNWKVYHIVCPSGCANLGTIYGTDAYAFGSLFCKAAIHAGFITDSGGSVTVRQISGLEIYQSSTKNGVTSLSTGASSASFKFSAGLTS